jgi:alpha-mannosidase
MLIASPLFSQTTIDRLCRQIDSIANPNIDDWRMSPNLTTTKLGIDPTQPGFDDSKWETLKVRQWVYPDSCWLRKEIVLPSQMYGLPIQGRVRLSLSVDDYGFLWVNGESKGYFPWDGDFIITEHAQPGDRFLLVIKAVNTGGPLRLLKALVETDQSQAFRQSLLNISIGFAGAQKLLSFDTQQKTGSNTIDPGTDKSAMDRTEKTRLNALLQTIAARVDVQALLRGDYSTFSASLDVLKPELNPIRAFVKRFTLVFASNAHIDAAWLWRSRETIEVCKETFSNAMKMMDARKDFTYTQSSAAYYDWMERLYPEVFNGIKQHVRTGQWEIIGGMWIEPDCNLISGDSWARHLLYAKKYFKEKFGVDVRIGWNPDSFGYNWNMPQFYRNAGIDVFITQKIGWNEKNVFPYRLFWWESPDGSRILSYFPFDYVNDISNPAGFIDWLRQYEANTGLTKMMVLYGVGDHGGGPSEEMLGRLDGLRALDLYPNIELNSATHYLDWVKHQDLTQLPVWKDELYLETHQGTFTTQANMKRWNRESEILFTNAEKFSSLASLYGKPYRKSLLEEGWKKVLFNQFHDILPGSSIREVYVDAKATQQEAQTIGLTELNTSLAVIVGKINTSAATSGTPVVLFNPLSWKRDEIVALDVPDGSTIEYSIKELNGSEIPSQLVSMNSVQRKIVFIVKDVPSLGYKTYILNVGKSKRTPSSLHVSLNTIENKFFKVLIDGETGWIKSIVDKRNNKELLTGPGNQLQLLQDIPKSFDAWNLGWTGVEFETHFIKTEIGEPGPVRASLKLYRDYRKPGTKGGFPTVDSPTSYFTQEIILYDDVARIDFQTTVDWHEERTMLKVAFPLTISDTVATYEIPSGFITRSTQWRDRWDSAKVEVPAQRWADLSQKNYGVSLLNKAKYGYDIKGSTMRLTLLKSPKWPDETADMHEHRIEYALYPHDNGWREAGTVRRGYEYNYPLIPVITSVHKGSLSSTASLVSLEPSNLILTSIKKAEDSEAWIYQWYESHGKDTKAVLTLPKSATKVVRTNFLEEDGEKTPFQKNTVPFETKRNSIVTLKIWY